MLIPSGGVIERGEGRGEGVQMEILGINYISIVVAIGWEGGGRRSNRKG